MAVRSSSTPIRGPTYTAARFTALCARQGYVDARQSEDGSGTLIENYAPGIAGLLTANSFAMHDFVSHVRTFFAGIEARLAAVTARYTTNAHPVGEIRRRAPIRPDHDKRPPSTAFHSVVSAYLSRSVSSGPVSTKRNTFLCHAPNLSRHPDRPYTIEGQREQTGEAAMSDDSSPVDLDAAAESTSLDASAGEVLGDDGQTVRIGLPSMVAVAAVNEAIQGFTHALAVRFGDDRSRDGAEDQGTG